MKKSIAILFLAASASAAPVVTPKSTSTFVGGTVTITSTDTITCAMASGSTGTVTSGCVFTAPRSIRVKSVLDGVQMLPNDHVYNTRIDSAPVDSNSTSRINALLGGTSAYIQFETNFPHNVMSDVTPTVARHFLYNSSNDGNFPILPAPYTGVEATIAPDDYFARDRHVLGVSTSPATGRFYDIYNEYPTGTNPSCPTCNSQSGIQYGGMSYDLAVLGTGGTTDAAGLYVQPLLLTYADLKSDEIKHALRFTMANGYIQSAFIWPGTANATPGCTPSSACTPYGARWRLKSSFPISSYSAPTQKVLTALKRYGMFMADGGTTMHLQANIDVMLDTTTYNTIQQEFQFGNIASQFAFEQVDESSYMVSASSGHVKTTNGYTTPDNYAEVVVTKVSDSSTTTVRIALQGVTVGTYNPAWQAGGAVLNVMAGTPQFQIPYWVKGATTTTATFSMSPTVGSLTSGGLYTAPTSGVTASSTTLITISPTVDSTNTITFPLTVFSSDSIRVKLGGVSSFGSLPTDSLGNYGPDATGKYWAVDPPGTQLGNSTKQDGGYPTSMWVSSATTPNIGLWYTYWPGFNDVGWGAIVPNGNYTLTMGFGIGDPGGTGISSRDQRIDSQGVTLISTGAFASFLGTTNYVPKTATFTVTVTDTRFYFALRTTNDAKGTLINWFKLTPNASSPTITSSLTASGTTGAAFSYFITASNNPTSYNATGLPSGLSVNTTTGEISGTPASSGVTNVTISATNSYGSGSDTLQITITDPPATGPQYLPARKWLRGFGGLRSGAFK